jgi:hypothetical protein
MKYIGSGLWAIAAAWTEISGLTVLPVVLLMIATLILIFGKDKESVRIINAVNHEEAE